MFERVLIVCTGNICRSPLAEGLLRRELAGRPIEVSSAGTSALVGWPADPMSVAVAAEHGLDISAHRARQASAALLGAHDLILTLDATHSRWLQQRHPQLRGRVHKLLKWQDDADVEDPFQRPRAAFDKAWSDCEQGVADWVQRLLA